MYGGIDHPISAEESEKILKVKSKCFPWCWGVCVLWYTQYTSKREIIKDHSQDWNLIFDNFFKIKMLSTILGCVCALVDGTPIMSTSDLDQLPPDGFARSRIIREFRQIAEYWSKPSLISPSAPNPSVALKHILKSGKGLLAFCVSCIFSHSH